MKGYSTKTLEKMAREKCKTFCCQEAKAAANDLIAYLGPAEECPNRHVQEIKRYCIQFVISMPADICPDEVTKEYFLRLTEKTDNMLPKGKKGFGIAVVKAFTSFIRNGLYNKYELSSWDDPELLDNLDDRYFRSSLLLWNALDENTPFSQMRVVPFKSKYHKKATLRLLVFDTKSKFLQDLLVELFFAVRKFNTFVCSHETQVITRRFEESFGSLPVPTNVMGFTPETFQQQILFFYHHASMDEVGIMKAIYLHIIQNLQGADTPFTVENGMEIGYISRCDVVECLKEGYRSIRLSSLEEVPSFDNWLVVVDDQTGKCRDILRKNRLVQVSFGDISLKYKGICKRWFINKKDTIVTTHRAYYLLHIKRFLSDLEMRHGKVQPLRGTDTEITLQDVNSYIFKDGKANTKARAALSSFLSYLRCTGEISVAPACFKYFPSVSVTSNNGDIEGYIPMEDFQKLSDGLYEKSQQKRALPIHKIVYEMFVMVSQLELRPSSVLSLRLSNIREYGGGQHYILVPTKTSNSHLKSYGIPQIIYESLQNVVKYTAEYRETAPQNIKDMLFITPNGKVVSEDTVSRIMKVVCRKIGLKEYTIRNVRKAYMTNVAGSIRRSEGSAVGYEQVFDHKDLKTTYGNYAIISKGECLMAVSKEESVKLNEKVRKRVKPDVNMDRKQLVSDGAGYCQQESCHIDGMADCFVCPQFITSLSFYDSFVRKREKIRKLLATEGFGKEIQEGYLLILNIIDMYITAMDEIRASESGKVELL